ncbi:MAG: hypothetical protein KDK33_04765 [Leptospiraceae bacterium]|nr:hypothetical protein [Leptospiraceae bacterium]
MFTNSIQKFRAFAWYSALLVAGLFTTALAASPSSSQYTPPGYGPGEQGEGKGWGIETGFTTIEDDYYITLKPSFELPLFWDFRIGLQIPLQVLVYDSEPKGTEDVPSIRTGTYDTWEDYSELVTYLRRGTHGKYTPGDWNWSFFYGKMTDGYIGHRTIIDRYVSTYDASVQSPGLMADINNDWGGLEYFQSNVLRKQVEAGRAYIRPVGIFISGYNAFFADNHSGRGFDSRQVAMSIRENRNSYYFETEPDVNPGQEGAPNHPTIPEPGKGGALRQYRLNRLQDDLRKSKVEFQEQTDPITQQTTVQPVEVPASTTDQGLQEPTPNTTTQPGNDTTDSDSDPFGASFWSRWAIGYTVARDIQAPLTLEYDGSNNLVVDPDTLRPRALDTEDLYIVGMDTEFKLISNDWLQLTPYVDINKVKDLENSKGIHAGINFDMDFNWVKINLKPEYREVTANYLPAYFDSYYAIERTVYIPESGDASGQTTTKLAYLKSLPTDGEKTKGYFVHGLAEFIGILAMEMNFEDYDGDSNSEIFVGIYTMPEALGGLFLNGYYSKKNYEGFSRSFIVDDNSLLAGELGFLFSGFYVKGVFQRTWQYDSNESKYLPQDESSVKFGFSSSM